VIGMMAERRYIHAKAQAKKTARCRKAEPLKQGERRIHGLAVKPGRVRRESVHVLKRNWPYKGSRANYILVINVVLIESNSLVVQDGTAVPGTD